MKKISIAFMAAMALASFGCKKKSGSGEAMQKMGEFKDSMCKCTDKACADKVQADMTKWSEDMAKKGGDKEAKVSEEDTKKMAAVGEEYGKCMSKAMMAGGGGTMGGSDMAGSDHAMGGSDHAMAGGSADMAGGSAAAPAAGGGGGDLPSECSDYKAMIEKLASCDKLPQASRDAFKQSFDAMSSAWANITPEAKAQVGSACKQAADTLKQAAGTMCGW